MEERKYRGLGQENLEFDEAMNLVKESVIELDEYVLDILFDILMEESDEFDKTTIIHNRS